MWITGLEPGLMQTMQAPNSQNNQISQLNQAGPLTEGEAWARRTMLPICRALRVDPEPMRPAAMWRDGGERRAERVYQEARDAALIRALRFT